MTAPAPPSLFNVNQRTEFGRARRPAHSYRRPRTSVELIDSIVGCDHKTRRITKLILALTGSIAAILLAIAAVGVNTGSLSTVLVCSGVVSVTALVVDRKASSRRASGHRSSQR